MFKSTSFAGLISALFLSFVGLALFACTGAMPGEVAQINLRIIKDDPLLAPAADGLQYSARGLVNGSGDAVTLDPTACYAVMVSAPDHPTLNRLGDLWMEDGVVREPPPEDLSCKYIPRYIGKVQGFYAYGAEAALSVPVGSNREFYLAMVPKTSTIPGYVGAPSGCAGTFSLEADNRTSSDAGEHVMMTHNGVKTEFDLRIVAYAKANVTSGMNAVDLRVIADQGGILIDSCRGGKDGFDTVPWISRDEEMVWLSSIITDPFIHVRCPHPMNEVQLVNLATNATIKRHCSNDDTTFRGLVRGTRYRLEILNGGTTPSQTQEFEIATNAGDSRHYPLATTAVGNPDFEFTYTPGYEPKLLYADAEQIVSYSEISGFNHFRSQSLELGFDQDPLLADAADTETKSGVLDNFIGRIVDAGKVFGIFQNTSLSLAYFNLFEPAAVTANPAGAPSIPSLSVGEELYRVLSEDGMQVAVAAPAATPQLIVTTNWNWATAQTIALGEGFFTNTGAAGLQVLKANNGIFIVVDVSDDDPEPEFLVFRCATVTSCESTVTPGAPTQSARLSFDGSINLSKVRLFLDDGGNARLAVLTKITSGKWLMNSLNPGSLSFTANALPGAATILFTDNESAITGVHRFDTGLSSAFLPQFFAAHPLSLSSSQEDRHWRGHLVLGGNSSSRAELWSSPDFGRNWFKTYTNPTSNTSLEGFASLTVPWDQIDAERSPHRAFMFLETSADASKIRYLLQNDHGF